MAGLEPARVAPADFESAASAIPPHPQIDITSSNRKYSTIFFSVWQELFFKFLRKIGTNYFQLFQLHSEELFHVL